MDTTERKIRCEWCEAVVLRADLLIAQSPWESEDAIEGCPRCHAVFGLRAEPLCDMPGCEQPRTGGCSDRRGKYREYCAAHDPCRTTPRMTA